MIFNFHSLRQAGSVCVLTGAFSLASLCQTSANAQKGANEAVIVPALRGIVFVKEASAVQPNGVAAAGLSTNDIAMLQKPAFIEIMEPYLNHPVTARTLKALSTDVVKYYRKQHHPLADVVVPEQDLQSGTLQVVVTEFRVGQVRAEGNQWFSDNVVTSAVTLNHGDTINDRRLLGELDAANANPFRRVDLVYTPSKQAGFTDVVLHTSERFPLRFTTGFDNSGVPSLGRSRWNAGVNWGNAFGRDQQVSYQFSSSADLFLAGNRTPGEPKGPSFLAHSVSWSGPLPWKDSLTIFGSYERSIPNIGNFFGLIGHSGQASLRYNHPLPRTEALTESASVGYDFKTTDNNLDFGGSIISSRLNEIDQFPIGYTGDLRDKLGLTSLNLNVVFSPGRLTHNNSNLAFQPATGQQGRLFAEARYVYWRSDLTRLTRLPFNATWASRVLGQVSSASLLDTEQLGVGGPEILRGYNPYSILGDQGITFSNELRSPNFSRPGHSDLPSLALGQTQFLVFWDYASLHNKHATGATPANLDGSSIGMGIRYNVRAYISFRLDYGWQLMQLPGSTGAGHVLNVGLVIGN